jgi:tetratricopeptide (TPR) repeat protein
VVLEIRLLGAVEVWTGDGRFAGLGTVQQRAVLAALAVDAGRPVMLQTLVERVWDEAPPVGTRPALYAHISRIRQALHQAEAAERHSAGLTRRAGGYVLEVGPDQVDLHRFRRLTTVAGDRDRSDVERVGLLSEALGLWRGTPLADLPGQWAARMREGWVQQRLDAVVAWARAELRLGRHDAVIDPVRQLLTDHPLVEPLAAVLIRALAAAGRDAEALDRYAATRARFVQDLGVEPGPELRAVHEAVLHGDLTRAFPRTQPVSDPGGVGRQVPAQLPGDVSTFTGRVEELAELDRLCGTHSGTDRPTDTSTAVVISAVSGTAGVGKTALAVHWSHQARARFPDGQLYVNLRGYDPDQPVGPADALAGFLAGLGVSGADIPVEVVDRAARYRTEIAGRRLLVLVDNASSVEQVRPLLPGTPSAMVLVTSRDSLPGLVAVHGARRVDLDLLPLREAVTLLRALIGVRVDDDPQAAATLAEQCARLPLALRVVAELAVSRPTTPLADLVGELSDEQRRLDLLDAGGDPRAAVRAAFSWSYQHLPPDAARMFRLSGLHPALDFDAYAATALVGTSLRQTRTCLDRLTRAHLVQRSARGRFSMHDLLRSYATGLSMVQDSVDDRRTALNRLFDYYLAAVTMATNTLYPAAAHPWPSDLSTATPDLSDLDTARTWLDAERSTLAAVVAYTADRGWPGHSVRLAATLHGYLAGGHHADALAIHGHARRAVGKTGDWGSGGHALHGLGTAHSQLGQYGPASDYLRQALALYREERDRAGEARALNDLGVVHEAQGRYQQASDHYLRALTLSRQKGDPGGEARALANLGLVNWRLGRYEQATDHLQRAIVLTRRTGDRYGEAAALTNLGLVEQRLGRYRQGADHHERALDLYRQLGHRQGEAEVLDNLGMAYNRLGQPEQATHYHQQALELFRESGDRDSQAYALNGLGEAAHAIGRHTDALNHHTAAIVPATETGSRDQLARAHAGLGRAHAGLGHPAEARQHYQQALVLYTELSAPEADDVRGHLAALDQT